jgi:WD40 repeat protein
MDGVVRVWDVNKGGVVKRFVGHTWGVDCVAFSPDGNQLASGEGDFMLNGKGGNEGRTIILWDVASGQVIRKFVGHPDGIQSVKFSPDGHSLASAGGDGAIRIWEVASGRLARKLPGDRPGVSCLTFSPDGTRLISARGNKIFALRRPQESWPIQIWDVASGQVVQTLAGHNEMVFSVAISRDGTRLASASGDRTVKVWDLATGQAVRTLSGHGGGVGSVAFHPDDIHLASADAEKVIRVWHVPTGRVVRTLLGHTEYIAEVTFRPDGTRLMSAAWDGTIKVWGMAAGRTGRHLTGHSEAVAGIAFRPDGTCLASASDDHTIKIWDLATSQTLRTLTGHNGSVTSVTFSPDGARLASASDDHTIKIWDPATGQVLWTSAHHEFAYHQSVVFSPDGKRLASVSWWDKDIKFWDPATGKLTQTLSGHTGKIAKVAISPDGTRLASFGFDKTIRVWDLATGQVVRTVDVPAPLGNTMAFSPDGARLAATASEGVWLWDLASGKVVQKLRVRSWQGCRAVVFSPDGSRLAAAGPSDVKVFDLASGQVVRTLAGHTCLAFSRDGLRLAAADSDNGITVWDARPLTPALRLECEAVAVVESWLNEPRLKADAADRIRTQKGITEVVRQEALRFLDHYRDEPGRFNSAGWDIVSQPDQTVNTYRAALGYAAVACQLAPGNGSYLNTLGVAQYRCGRYREALDTLTKSNALHTAASLKENRGRIVGLLADPWGLARGELWGFAYPHDLAFLAMTRYQLGQKTEARALLGRLRTVMTNSRWANDSEAQVFLREAEALIRN